MSISRTTTIWKCIEFTPCDLCSIFYHGYINSPLAKLHTCLIKTTTVQPVLLHHSQVLEESKTLLIPVNGRNVLNVKLMIWVRIVYLVRTF